MDGNKFFGVDIQDKKIFYHLIKEVVILWLISWILIVLYLDGDEARGQFGDMFGAVNSLFSGLAFAGIIYTIILQQREISEQREEIERERFEKRFFLLFNQHIEFIKMIDLRDNKKIVTSRGRDCFGVLYREFKKNGAG